MVVFPNAKINLGLQVLNKRPDGYHEIETVFYPVPLFDSLEVIEAERFSFTQSGIIIEGSSQNNSTVQAYELLAKEYALPPIEIHLHKNIPIGAGLGEALPTALLC